jgi:hypothetical protein
VAVGLLIALAGCGGDGGDAPAPSVGQATLDAAGGTVDGPDGVKLVVPAAALQTATTLRIARDGSGAPELGGAKAISPVYAVTPHGTAFAESARISIPFKPEDVAPGTQPVILRAQPGGGWEALPTDVQGGTVSAADTPGLSFYTVGTCYTTLDFTSPYEVSPLFACPSAHTLQLTLRDSNGAVLPLPRRNDLAQPAMTVSAPTTLDYTLSWTRPAGTVRSDTLDMTVSGIGLLPAQQPLSNFSTPRDFSMNFSTPVDPATVPGAGAAGGVIIKLKAAASYTTDAFYPGCLCFKPATWTFTTEIPVRVVYTGTQPVITQQPQNRNVIAGQAATLSVAATGPNLSYQWSSFRAQSQTAIAGATQASHTTPATTPADDNTLYAVEVCSNRGTAQQRCINSDAALLRVSQLSVAPTFGQGPQSISVQSGQTASFSATANGQPAPAVTWARVRTLQGGFTTSEPVCTSTTGSGTQTSASCTIGPLTAADNGARIVAEATNAAGSVTSVQAVVTVTAAPVAPTLASPAQPDDRTVIAGQSLSWTVSASGTAPLSYTWRTVSPGGTLNATVVCASGVLPPQTASGGTLTLTSVPLECNGHRFQAVVSNGVQPDASSRQALLTVNPAPAAPSITTPLTSLSAPDGTAVTFNVGATGNPATFTYTWTLDGAAVSNPTSGCTTASAACTFTARLADTGKTVRVVVANGTAPDATSQATLTVAAAPSARTWQNASLLQNSAFQTEGVAPELAVDSAGNVRAVWIERPIAGGSSVVSALLTPAGGWGPPATVHSTANPVSQVQVAVDGLGNAVAMWLQAPGGQPESVWVSRYTPAGGWSAALQLDTDGQSSEQSLRPLALAMDGAGNAIALWRHAIAGSGGWWGIFHARFEPATGWTAPAALSLGANVTAASSPSVGFDAAGNAVALWVQAGSAGNNIASARHVPGSGWTATTLIEASDDSASEPKVAVDASGDAAAVWLQGSRVWSNRYTAGVGWGAAVQVEAGSQPALAPRVTIDGSGNALALWGQSDGIRPRIWANRRAAGGGWGAPTAISAAGVEGYDAALAGNADGRGIAVWRSYDPAAGRYTTTASNFAPGSGWSVPVAIEPTTQARPPDVVLDANGDATAVWPRQGSNAWQIWFNRYR